MTPKKLLAEIEQREEEFHKVTEIVRNHRAASSCKTVWVTRGGEGMKEDLVDAQELPGIKDKLDQLSQHPDQHQQATFNTLFSAAEGVGRAKSLAYFDDMQALKKRLKDLARKDEENGTTTMIKCSGQQGLVLPGLEESEQPSSDAPADPGRVAEAAAAAAAQTEMQVSFNSGEAAEIDEQAVEAMRARMRAVLGSAAPAAESA